MLERFSNYNSFDRNAKDVDKMNSRIKQIVLIITLLVLGVDRALADGKLLIFSTPPERVASKTNPPTRPIYLCDSTEREHIPVPAPASNLSDFGFSNKHVFYRGAFAPMKYAQRVSKSNTSKSRASQNVKSNDANKSTAKALPFSESLWNETYNGEIRCDDPQLAHSIKAYVESLINSKPKKPVSDNGEYVPSADEPARSFFNNAETRVIIAWNGKRNSEGKETMIISSGASSAYRGGITAALSIIPLPGPPISVTPVSQKAFFNAKSLFLSRTPSRRNEVVAPSVVSPTRIGCHNIFILRLDDVQDFYRQVTNYVLHKYNSRAFPFLDSETLRVLEYYFERGFRYFAFDLTEVGLNSEKETVAYTFKSSAVYYPLVINRIGGTDQPSTVDLIVMTPGKVSPTGASAIQRVLLPGDKRALAHDAATLVGGGTVRFSIDEVRAIDKQLDVFDEGTNSLLVRNIRFKKTYNSYVKDFFILSSSGSGVHMEENPPSEPQNPNNDSGASNPKVDDNSKNGNDAASKEKAPQTSTEKSETDKAPEQPQAQNAPAESGEAPSQEAPTASQESSDPSEQAPTPANSGSEPTEQQEEQEQPTQ